MFSSIRRRPLAVLAHMPNTSAKVPRRNTSWIGFEQPDPRLYLKPPTPAVKKPTTPRETPQAAQPTVTPINKTESWPAHPTKTPLRQFQAGATRVPSQIRNLATLLPRSYTDFKSGPWRDQYLPTTRICIPGVPATWGPDETAFSVVDELHISASPRIAQFCFDNAVEEQASAEIKAFDTAVAPADVETTLPTIETILAQEMAQAEEMVETPRQSEAAM